jgi:hypothetical protein
MQLSIPAVFSVEQDSVSLLETVRDQPTCESASRVRRFAIGMRMGPVPIVIDKKRFIAVGESVEQAGDGLAGHLLHYPFRLFAWANVNNRT